MNVLRSAIVKHHYSFKAIIFSLNPSVIPIMEYFGACDECNPLQVNPAS